MVTSIIKDGSYGRIVFNPSVPLPSPLKPRQDRNEDFLSSPLFFFSYLLRLLYRNLEAGLSLFLGVEALSERHTRERNSLTRSYKSEQTEREKKRSFLGRGFYY